MSDRRRFFAQTGAVLSALAVPTAAVRRGESAKAKDAHPVAAPAGLELRMITVDPTDPHTALYGKPTPCVVAVPRGLAADARLPLAVLLPGGEHTMQKREHGCWGWWSDFHLGEVETLVRRGALTANEVKHATDAHLATFNARLATNPYRPMVIATPFVLRRQTELGPHGAMNLAFLRALVAKLRKDFPVSSARAATGLGGVSASGLWALWCGAQLDDLFSSVVAVQPYTDGYEDVLRKVLKARKTSQAMRVITSTGDRLHAPTVKWLERMTKEGVAIEHAAYPGPHLPEFVAGSGGVEMLLSMDRFLARTPAVLAQADAGANADAQADANATANANAHASSAAGSGRDRAPWWWLGGIVAAAVAGASAIFRWRKA